MKNARYFALMALLLLIVATSINCVQNTTPQPSPSPTASPSPTPEPAAVLTQEQKTSIYSTATSDPYVRERILKTAWRSTHQDGDQFVRNTSYMQGNAGYMSFREIGPDFDRIRTLPAVEIIAGNASEAGVNVIAFVDMDLNRVAGIGFVPRQGVSPVPGATFLSVEGGVDERDASGGLHQYRNVTVVDTGYIKGMSLSHDQKDQISSLAMRNATVRKEFGNHNADMSDFSVYSYEIGYPYRYVLAYPMVIINVTDGPTTYDPIYVLADPASNRVVKIGRGIDFP